MHITVEAKHTTNAHNIKVITNSYAHISIYEVILNFFFYSIRNKESAKGLQWITIKCLSGFIAQTALAISENYANDIPQLLENLA